MQEDRALRDLAASIQLNGLVISISVIPVSAAAKSSTRSSAKSSARASKTKTARTKAAEPTYLMRSGHRRRAALELLLQQGNTSLPPGHARITNGEIYVQAVICGDMTKKEAGIAALIDNLEREPLTPYEQACAVKTLAEDKQIDREDLAQRVGTDAETVDYMISALNPKNLSLTMINAWKQRQLEMGHIKLLYRLRRHKKRQKLLYSKILKEQLTVPDAKFWCNQLIDEPDRPLEDREHNLMAKRLLAQPKLRKLIDDKKVKFGHSVRGDKMVIKAEGARKMRETCLLIAAALEDLDP